jgi:hypothetical protein
MDVVRGQHATLPHNCRLLTPKAQTRADTAASSINDSYRFRLPAFAFANPKNEPLGAPAPRGFESAPLLVSFAAGSGGVGPNPFGLVVEPSGLCRAGWGRMVLVPIGGGVVVGAVKACAKGLPLNPFNPGGPPMRLRPSVTELGSPSAARLPREEGAREEGPRKEEASGVEDTAFADASTGAAVPAALAAVGPVPTAASLPPAASLAAAASFAAASRAFVTLLAIPFAFAVAAAAMHRGETGVKRQGQVRGRGWRTHPLPRRFDLPRCPLWPPAPALLLRRQALSPHAPQ